MPPRNNRETWIFLRGLVRESAHWEGFVSAFEKRFGVRAVAIDLPGNGEHHAKTTPVTLAGLMESVRADWIARRREGEAPPFLFALSLGAMVGLTWMHRYPDEVAGAVLVNTSLRGFSPFFQRMSPFAYGTLARIFLDSNVKRRERRLLELTTQNRSWDEGMLRRRVEVQKERPISRANAFRQLLAALSPVETRKPPKQPVLLLNSLGDLLVHPDCSKDIAKSWNVPLRRHAWAGHDLPLDDPEWALSAVADWRESLSPSNPDALPAKSK